MEFLGKCIRAVDVVGFGIQQTYSGSNRTKTVLGGFLSTVLFALMAFGFIYFGRDMTTRSSPRISTIKRKVDNANIPYGDFPFFVSITDIDGRVLNHDPEFNRSVRMFSQFVRIDPAKDGGNPISSYLVAPVIKCNDSIMKEEYFDLAEQDGYDPRNSLCIDYKETEYSDGRPYDGEVYIRNERLSVNSGLVTFSIEACDAEADPGCRGYLERTGAFWVKAQMPDYFEVSSDYENPIKKNFAVVSHDVNLNFFRKDKINFEINELVTDKGIILEDTFTDEYMSVNSFDLSVDFFSETNRMIYQVVLSAKQIKNTTNRRYLKLQELMANVGGFMKAALFVASGICHQYSKFVLYCEINKTIGKTRFETEKRDNFIPPKENSSKVEIKAKLPKFKENLHKVSFFNYILALFSNKTRKKHSIDSETTFRFLDLTYLIPQLIKIENAKLNTLSKNK